MRGKRITVFSIVLLLVLSLAVSSIDLTREGIKRTMSEGDSIQLDFKDMSCEIEIVDITRYGTEIEVCSKDIMIEDSQFIDVDDDNVFDIYAKINPESDNIIDAVFKLTYKVDTNLDEEPIIEEVDYETEKIINESGGDVKELIRKLSIKAGLIDEEKTEQPEENESEEDPELMPPPTWQGVKGEMSKTFDKIVAFPYLMHIAIGLVILAVLIALIHFGTNDSAGNKVSGIFFEEDKKPKKSSKKKSAKKKSKKKK